MDHLYQLGNELRHELESLGEQPVTSLQHTVSEGANLRVFPSLRTLCLRTLWGRFSMRIWSSQAQLFLLIPTSALEPQRGS